VSELASIGSVRRPGTCVVDVKGEIDFSNASDVMTAIEREIPDDVARVALDLSATSYLDSAGIRLVLELAERLSERRISLTLVVPKGAPISSVLELMDVVSVVEVTDRLPAD
jgi:anti-anti-sigma factor